MPFTSFGRMPHASSWTPASLPNLASWYDASNAGSITSSGGAVSQWNDLSGNARHLTQATGARQPITGTRTVNGLNVLDFNGTSHWMLSSSFAHGASVTVVSIAQGDVTTGFDRGVFSTDTNASPRLVQHRWNSSSQPQTVGFSGGVAKTATGSGGSVTALHLYLSVLDSSGQTMTNFINGSQNGQATATGALDSGSCGVAVGLDLQAPQGWWDGPICEVIYCASALGSTDRASLLAYSQAKWGTP